MLMICPEGHRDCLCGHKYKHPKEDSCDKEKCSGSLPCIPYIPERPKKPATCPECGHPIERHGISGCFVPANPFAKELYCQCKRTPADLKPGDTVYTSLGRGVVVQPESGNNAVDLKQEEELPPANREGRKFHYMKAELEFSNWCDTCRKRVGCKGNVGQVMSCPEYEAERQVSRDFDTIEHETAEPEMPLLHDEIVRRRIEDIFVLILETGKWCDWDINAILTAIIDRQQAHDQQVRQTAVKEFVEQAIVEMKGSFTEFDLLTIKRLRAMAELESKLKEGEA